MRFSTLSEFLAKGVTHLAKGPVALVFAEDEVEVDSTLRHHLSCGFKAVVLLATPLIEIAADVADRVVRVDYDTLGDEAVQKAVNAVNDKAPGLWLYYCYNAEYLFYPFCETRSVGEMLAFHAEERRFAMLTYVIDAYAGDLGKCDDAVSLDEAFLDRSGYYALGRDRGAGNIMERQLDFFGGLRWRYEEHISEERRRIDRIALVRTRPDIRLRPDHTWTDEELNTYSCPWHHNLTAAIVSFRTAKALRTNPASRFEIDTFKCHSSTRFQWNSQQLLDLGLMEPGQWF